MLTGTNGFPLRIRAFECNKLETTAFVPQLEALTDTYGLSDVTVVAGAGMISDTNRRYLEQLACPTCQVGRPGKCGTRCGHGTGRRRSPSLPARCPSSTCQGSAHLHPRSRSPDAVPPTGLYVELSARIPVTRSRVRPTPVAAASDTLIIRSTTKPAKLCST